MPDEFVCVLIRAALTGCTRMAEIYFRSFPIWMDAACLYPDGITELGAVIYCDGLKAFAECLIAKDTL